MKPLSIKAKVVAKMQSAISQWNKLNNRTRLFFFLIVWLCICFELCISEILMGVQGDSLIWAQNIPVCALGF